MSIWKITLGALAAIIAICSVMYYLTLYPVPLTLADPILPTPTATAETEPSKPVKEAPIPRPVPETRGNTSNPAQTNRVKRTPRPTNPLSQQKWPLGKPKPTPVIKPKATPVK